MNAAPLQPGDVLGGYEIVSLLGRGGMGVVYRARRPGTGEVALKTLLGDVASEEADRFRREIDLLAALRHPAIIPVYSAGEDKGVLFYAMGIIEGESLEAKIRREGRLPPKEAARIVTEIATAIAFAHERKIIHRDLKPANVLLDAEGHVFVTDFGLGRQLGDESQRLTRTGEILGTPFFMAPEQALGHSKRIDERADVYGLGAILYCMLAGRPPFIGATALETIRLVRDRPADPIEGLSPELAGLLARVLAKNPDARPQTAHELSSELEEALAPRRGLPQGLLAGLLVVAVVCMTVTGALVRSALERRRHGQGETAASPSPVASTVVPVNSRLASLLDDLKKALERKATTLPKEPLLQIKSTLESPHVEAERELARAALARVYERALDGSDDARLEQLATLALPLPEDSALKTRIARRWISIASKRVPAGFDPGAMLQKIASSGAVLTETDLEAALKRGLVTTKPVLDALRRARLADATTPTFPPELETFFGRLFLGLHVANALTYREVWRDVLQGFDEHPVREFLEARFAIGDLDLEAQRLGNEMQDVRIEALVHLGHSREELVSFAAATPSPLGDLYKRESDARPGSEVFKRAEEKVVSLTIQSQEVQTKGHVVILTLAEKALSSLKADGSTCSRDLAEMFLFEVLRHLVWFTDPTRLCSAFDSFSGLVRDESQAYSLRFAKAGSEFTRGAASGWADPNTQKAGHDWDGISRDTALDHDLHLRDLAESLTSSPSSAPGGR